MTLVLGNVREAALDVVQSWVATGSRQLLSRCVANFLRKEEKVGEGRDYDGGNAQYEEKPDGFVQQQYVD